MLLTFGNGRLQGSDAAKVSQRLEEPVREFLRADTFIRGKLGQAVSQLEQLHLGKTSLFDCRQGVLFGADLDRKVVVCCCQIQPFGF